MTSLTKFMFAFARHRKHVYFRVNAVLGTDDASLRLPFKAGFKKQDGIAALKLLGADGLNQGQDALSWKVPKNLRRKGTAVRSHATMTTEAPVLVDSSTEDSVQKVVIVGAGIAGLSAAVALHRVGIKALVLERSSVLRTSGAALGIWGNALRALEVLGAVEGLRENHSTATRMEIYTNSGDVVASFAMTDYPGGPHELRTIPRKTLIETLASQLPEGTIQLNSRVRAIHRQPHERSTKVELENGSVISTKILVGCDGLHSVVGKWIGIPPARYAGAISFQAIAEYPGGHNFGTTFRQYIGRTARAGISPITPTTVYWFLGARKSSPGSKVTDPSVNKQELLELLTEGFPDTVHSLLNNTRSEALSRAALYDRLNLPASGPPFVKDGMTVAGDAMHPMQPTLGQGGCVAIEDGVMLARVLGDALSRAGNVEDSDEAIHKALERYAAERQRRGFLVTLKSFMLGKLYAKRAGRAKYVIDNYIMPKFAPRLFLGHTLYDVGELHPLKITRQ